MASRTRPRADWRLKHRSALSGRSASLTALAMVGAGGPMAPFSPTTLDAEHRVNGDGRLDEFQLDVRASTAPSVLCSRRDVVAVGWP